MLRLPRRFLCAILVVVALSACTPTPALPFSEPAAAVVDGHEISMRLYEARLLVTRHRDPFAGIEAAAPSPSPRRLKDFTIQQLIREEIVRQEADRRGIAISSGQVDARITSLRKRAGPTAFDDALARNGFTTDSFRSYQQALLTEVSLAQLMARDRIRSADAELRSGAAFAAVAARWSDDAGTFARGGDIGWLKPADLPEPELAHAVGGLSPGERTAIVSTARGFVIATLLEQRAEQDHIAVVLVLAPSADLYTADSRPKWFARFIDDRKDTLQRAGKIQVRVAAAG